jgi:hypothetical protein
VAVRGCLSGCRCGPGHQQFHHPLVGELTLRSRKWARSASSSCRARVVIVILAIIGALALIKKIL